jgi:hypothetical protein
MHIWTELAAREAVYLALLLAIGAGPASFLSARFDAGSRIGFAPVLGFCVGTCVTTTLLQFWPTNDTYWVLIPLALASLALAAWRTIRSRGGDPWRRRLPLTDIGAMVLVGLAVTGPINSTLHSHHTAGPAIYFFTDGDNYVAVQDAAQTVSLHTAHLRWKQYVRTGVHDRNLVQFTWDFFANQGSNLDATPLDSNVNALLGLGATGTFAPFLTVLLLAGALAAFAAVRYWSRSRSWLAVLAGALFGGSMFLELWFDSYQAALIAIGLVTPFVMLCDNALSDRRRATLVLIALVVATFLTVYPLYLAILAAAAGLMLLARAVDIRRTGGRLRPLIRPLACALGLVVVLAILFDLVGFTRDVRYYRIVLNGDLAFPRVGYSLPLSVLPGWLAQTREFWNMPPLGSADIKQLLLGGLLPLVFVGFVIVALRRFRPALALVGLAAVCAVLAEYSYLSEKSCTYCAERDLLPLGPIAAVLIALGLCALLASVDRRARVAGVLGALLVVATVGQRARIELKRFSNDSYFMDPGDRAILTKLPRQPGSILEEGFGSSVFAQAEQPLVYHLINERYPDRQSIVLGSNLGNAIAYLDFGQVVLPPGPEFDPNYRFVLTRFSGVATARRLIARDGAVALEERVKPLDVVPYAGLATPFERLDQAGTVWVQTQYPLQMLVVGDDGNRPTWARLTFYSQRSLFVPRQSGVRSRIFGGHKLVACLRATGAEPVREARIGIDGQLVPGTPPPGLFPPPMPLEGLELTSMYALAGHCTL